MDAIAFKTRARTIDHLGREQIADCPTAISELWKNAYDAYARSVALNIFDGDVPTATVVDDGHGMSRDDFENRWLIVGTESKFHELEVAQESLRRGLRARPKQGQKGIGRLSSAYLGPLLLLLSKKEGSPFVASLIDWRLFENPFLYLSDIQIPIAEFSQKEEVFRILPALFEKLMGNVWGDSTDADRRLRIERAWREFDEYELRIARASTRQAIEESLISATFTERHFDSWPVWRGDSVCGTALVVANISFDLEAQLDQRAHVAEGDIAKQARDKLTQTLVNFTDPFLRASEIASDIGVEDFNYSVVVWTGALQRTIVSSQRAFTYENLASLEHLVDGTVAENGTFKGRVKAFGKWIDGEVVIPAMVPIPTRSDSRIGEFQLRVGTIEQLQRTSLEESLHSTVTQQMEHYGGFMMFRNGLRIMPYGRVDNDFFEIELRRSTHAGREFWSYRRMFGRIALSRERNPNLRDKAGREGIIDNKAAKVFRDVVNDILMTTARRFFGTDSKIRQAEVPLLEERYAKRRAEEAHQKVRARMRREFRGRLERGFGPLHKIHARLQDMAAAASASDLPEEAEKLEALQDEIAYLRELRSDLNLGPPPRTLGSLATKYAEFRKLYSTSAELIGQLSDSLSVRLERIRPLSAKDIAYSELSRNAAFLQARVRRWNAQIREIYSAETTRISALVDERNKAYHAEALPLVSSVEDGSLQLQEAIRTLGTLRDSHDNENTALFDGYISTLRNLQENADLDALVAVSIDELDSVRSDLLRLNALAQLGITVEIIGHEIDGLESTISHGLASFPQETKQLRAFRSVWEAHNTLAEKLRFLSPLKLSGEQQKSWISGEQIRNYVVQFLGRILDSTAISITWTEQFLNFAVYELPSRIYPVFTNLINNSIYWISQLASSERQILIEVEGSTVYVSDDGPGVDEEDVKHLFTLFFTRKSRSGRGVGLYLCRSNLAAGGHTISYVSEKQNKKLSGANFAIEFKGR